MEITVPNGMQVKEWFNTKEFAAGVQSTPHAVNQWIHRHREFAEKYCQNVSKNPKRTNWLIFWEGIAVYIAQKSNTSRRSKALSLRGLKDAQEKVGQKANETIKQFPGNGQLSPAQALLQAVQLMVSLEEKLNKVEVDNQATNQRLVQLEEKVQESIEVVTKPVASTEGQRRLLNDRVRHYCITHNLPYHIIWRQIHEHVGVYAVQNYEFRHYQASLKYLEKMYSDTGLVW